MKREDCAGSYKSLSCIPAHRVKGTFWRRPETVETGESLTKTKALPYPTTQVSGSCLGRAWVCPVLFLISPLPPIYRKAYGKSCFLSFLHNVQNIRHQDTLISKMFHRLHPIWV